MENIFNSWEESLVFDIALRRQYAVSIEERLGWPTYQFHAGILELIKNNQRGRHEQTYELAYQEIAEVVQQTIIKTHQVDRVLHQKNLVNNRDRLFEWLDNGWYKRWIEWNLPVDEIKRWVNQSYSFWEHDSLWDSIIDAERSTYWGTSPRSWLCCYRDALATYLAELYAPSHYAFKAIPFPEYFSMRSSSEIDDRIDYITTSSAIDTQPDQSKLPESLRGKAIITINVSNIFNQGVPCSSSQNSECTEAFLERSYQINDDLDGEDPVFTHRDGIVIVGNLQEVQRRLRRLWTVWLEAGFYSIDGGEPTDHFRRAPVQLADRWSLLVDEMPKNILVPNISNTEQNLFLGT